jgi:hypothetical protein
MGIAQLRGRALRRERRAGDRPATQSPEAKQLSPQPRVSSADLGRDVPNSDRGRRRWEPSNLLRSASTRPVMSNEGRDNYASPRRHNLWQAHVRSMRRPDWPASSPCRSTLSLPATWMPLLAFDRCIGVRLLAQVAFKNAKQ